MRLAYSFVATLAGAILVGCDVEDRPQNSRVGNNATMQEGEVAFLDAEEMCEKWLADAGLSAGRDKKGRIITIGSAEADVGQFAKWGMDGEQMRNVIAKEAYLNAIREIGQSINTDWETTKNDDPSGTSLSTTIACRGKADLLGVRIVHQCETFNAEENTFCAALVMVYDKSFSTQLKEGRVEKLGVMSIYDWLGRNDGADLLGVHYYCDDKGKGWLIGGYTVSAASAVGRETFWRRKAEDLMPYALGGEVNSYRMTTTIMRENQKSNTEASEAIEENFEDGYYGSDGTIRSGFGDPDEEVFSSLEDHIDVRPAYAGVRGSVFLEREGVSPVNAAKTKMFIVAAQVPEKE